MELKNVIQDREIFGEKVKVTIKALMSSSSNNVTKLQGNEFNGKTQAGES